MGRAHEVRKVAMAKTAAVKSKLYAKYGKEIYMAAKSGIPDPDNNLALRSIIAKAKKEQVSADVIKRAIDKAKGGQGEDYQSVRYEGFGSGNSLLIVECLTDNVSRTYTDVRSAFTKCGGKLGVTGSVLFQFTHQAVVTVLNVKEDEILDILITNDIDADIETTDNDVTIFGDAALLFSIKTALQEANPLLETTTEEIVWIPQVETVLDDEAYGKFERLYNILDELDDVQEIFHNVKVPSTDDEDE
ncbi:MAG: YebC/PmpR family DNA-binding transcriptional regulator [Acholeplasmatales bacterium]|jgi:YebC/PmpR family DNA-binding regulatory protein|nr:YebC/PmpR family DNA-binding transcriptional regulator [Acholeplasmatales bacterium]